MEGRHTLNPGDCVVLFSGGADSTLSAIKLLDDHRKVHLVSYEHFGMAGLKKIEIRVKRMMEKFPDRFIYHFEDMNDIYKRIHFKGFWGDCKKFGYYWMCTTHLCMGCKLGMFTLGLRYCLQNNIKYIAAGASKSQAFFPEQKPEIMQALGDFLAEYDVKYISPVYDVDDANKHLYEMGISDSLKYSDIFSHFRTQPYCFLGWPTQLSGRAILWKGNWITLYGEKASMKACLKYLTAKFDVTRRYLENALNQSPA